MMEKRYFPIFYKRFNRYMVECEYMNRGAGDLRQAQF